MKDLACEGKYFEDPTLEQTSLVRINLGASSKGESMGDSSVEPSSSIGNHINWNFGLMSKSIIVGVAPDSTTSREQIERTCSFTNDIQEKNILFTNSIETKDKWTIVSADGTLLIEQVP